jgi:hypothetical protein
MTEQPIGHAPPQETTASRLTATGTPPTPETDRVELALDAVEAAADLLPSRASPMAARRTATCLATGTVTDPGGAAIDEAPLPLLAEAVTPADLGAAVMVEQVELNGSAIAEAVPAEELATAVAEHGGGGLSAVVETVLDVVAEIGVD